jgi:hypothetical protein
MFEPMRTLFKRLETKRRHPEEISYGEEPREIIIFGMGRIGVGAGLAAHVCDALDAFKTYG